MTRPRRDMATCGQRMFTRSSRACGHASGMSPPSLLWFRRDLRLDDNPALCAALRAGAVVPVYVHAPGEEAPWAPGAASEAWLRASLRKLDDELRALGSRLVLRRGPTLAALQRLLAD